MAYPQWTEELSVGLHAVDSQHKQLFAISQALHTAILDGQGQEAVKETFKALAAYVNRHFLMEEDYMSAIGYPELQAHKEQHEALRQRLQRLWHLDRVLDPIAPEEVTNFLGHWLSGHILVSDKAIGEFVRSPGKHGPVPTESSTSSDSSAETESPIAMHRHFFFTIISREEFITLLKGFTPLKAETADLSQARNRVLAVGLTAPHDWPLLTRSCMDGFAVNARDVFGASESNPGYLECVASLAIDRLPDIDLLPGECARIATGGILPSGADAVVMVEHTQAMEEDAGNGTIEIRKSAAPGDNVMQRAEDARADKTALAAGTVMRPQEIGLAAALGFQSVRLRQRPRVGILSTGDELIDITATPVPGQVRDVNSLTLSALVEQAGGIPNRCGIIKDDLPSLTDALNRALTDNDLVLLSGGSSIGVRDLTVKAIESMDEADILAHGVALSPGKPTILGRVGHKAVLGLPGQVTSALVVMHVLVLPLIRHLQGDRQAFSHTGRTLREAVLTRNLPSKPGREDYARIRLEERDGEPPLAHPVLGKSGLLRTMVNASGLTCIPAESEGLYKGDLITVWVL